MLHPLDSMQLMLYNNYCMQHKEFYTTTEIAKIIGLSRSQVFRKIQNGEIPSEKMGRYNLVPRFFVDAFLGRVAQQDERQIAQAVSKTMGEYGDVIKMLKDT